MTFIDNILKNRILTHILFWVVMLIFTSQVFFYAGQNLIYSLTSISVLLPSMLIAAYFLVYYQVPKLVYKKKYFQFVISLIVSAYICTVLARLLTVLVAEPLMGIVELTPKSEMLYRVLTSISRLARSYLLSIYIIPIIMLGIKLIKQKSEEQRKLESLEKEKATSELNFLKAQVHPHFLLNTLNNIYALSLKKSDKTPESILKLSEMLTYVLYKCNEKYVLLDNEIQLLKNYIDLERLRYGEELQLHFDNRVTDHSIKIAPVILLSIVENAFKHGVSGAIDNPEVNIYMETIDNMLLFKVFNTKNEFKQDDATDYTKGIGSENVKKQLDLLYPNMHTFEVNETRNSYEVTLKLQLNTNNYGH